MPAAGPPLPAWAFVERLTVDRAVLSAVLLAVALVLVVFLAAPLGTLLGKSFDDGRGTFVGLANYARYFTSPSLAQSIYNTAYVGAMTTAICVPIAFAFAYAITHTAMPGKSILGAIVMLPLLAPSLLPAMSFVYLFGNQGILKDVIFSGQIYGAHGIILAQVFFCLPQAVLILVTAMMLSDARLYEASACLAGSRWTTFARVTLPSCRYGLISACFVVFTLVTTDFGVPKILGGNFGVLSTDMFKQVVGQQNFEMGAVVGVVMLMPTVIAFVIDHILRRKHAAMFSSRSVPYEPEPSRLDWPAFALCVVVCALIVGVMAVACWASFVKLWPYNLSLTFANYRFADFDVLGWQPYWASIRMAALVAAFGTAFVFLGAYLVERFNGMAPVRSLVHFLAIMPVAIPGVVLGLGYIFFLNNPANPLSFLFGGMAAMVINTIVHFYTVPHLTAVTALRQLDKEFEVISDSLRASRFQMFFRVTVPLCSIVILDIAAYLFVNAMTTVAAIIFLYTAETKTASIAAINMDDSGMPSAALAMGMMILYTCIVAKALQVLAARLTSRRLQKWRERSAVSTPDPLAVAHAPG